MNARYWIEKLDMTEHPEGGFFRETYRSDESIPSSGLPARFGGSRPFSTAIYFLVTYGHPSNLHRLKADEIWHFYEGTALTLSLFYPDREYREIRLGRDREKGEHFQAVVPAGCWFGAVVEEKDGFSLVGCTVAPGFDFDDFQLADRAGLLRLFPEHQSRIEQLTSAISIQANRSLNHDE